MSRKELAELLLRAAAALADGSTPHKRAAAMSELLDAADYLGMDDDGRWRLPDDGGTLALQGKRA